MGREWRKRLTRILYTREVERDRWRGRQRMRGSDGVESYINEDDVIWSVGSLMVDRMTWRQFIHGHLV